ncbi:MAG: TlpA family protein disulfide reductase [Actinomycetota bacterium]|nr:TlpA family protein disulfide reductase [Actinomycetota bacterium]
MVPLEELQEYSRDAGRRRLVPWALAAIGAAALLVFLLQPSEEAEQPRRLTSFELPLLDGGTLSDDDLRGRPVVLNFFASWCKPCREEAPLLEKTYREYEEAGVQFVGVDVMDTKEDVRRFVREFGITYPIVTDYDLVLSEQLRTGWAWPQTYFLDSDLVVAASASGEEIAARGDASTLGAIEEADLRAGIESLLEASE